MIISDLNYLETANQEVFGGSKVSVDFDKNIYTNIDPNINFDFTSNVNEKFYKNGGIYFDVDVKDNSSTLTFENEAYGQNTLTEFVGGQLVIEGKLSSQYGKLVAAAEGSKRY